MIESSTPYLRPETDSLESPADRLRILLELLHPDGFAERARIVGSGLPRFSVQSESASCSSGADLIILAPTEDECRTDGWLERAVQSLDQETQADGLVYVLAPRRWRRSIAKLLASRRLSIELQIAHLPDWRPGVFLVPLYRNPAQYAFSHLIEPCPWRRRIARIAFLLPWGESMLARIFPWLALVARRPRARRLFDWVLRPQGGFHGGQSAVISASWRAQGGATVLHLFSDREPVAVAKVAEGGRVSAEAQNLNRLSQSARAAGMEAPQVLCLYRQLGREVLLQTVVKGRSAVALLESSPGRLFEIMQSVVAWLERWNRSTVIFKPLNEEFLRRELMGPAELLAPLIDRGPEHLGWLASRCEAIKGTPVPLVATHNDLTMWNLLLEENGRIGLVDWESSREEGLPLVDFFYCMTDAVSAAGGYNDRLSAFKSCFAGGVHARTVGGLQRRLEEAVGITPEVAEICLHACWLHHAANERRSADLSGQRPFLEILRWIVFERFRSGAVE